MLKLFRNLLRRDGDSSPTVRRPNPSSAISVRRAAEADTAILVQLIIEGAHEGHFHPALGGAGPNSRGLYVNLQSTIRNGLWYRSLAPPEAVGANIYVYEVGGTPAGFVIVAEAQPGTSEDSPPEYELLLMAIARHARGNGHGSRLLTEFLKAMEPPCVLHARCYPASDRMTGMLRQRGFVLTGTTPAGTRRLVLKRLC